MSFYDFMPESPDMAATQPAIFEQIVEKVCFGAHHYRFLPQTNMIRTWEWEEEEDMGVKFALDNLRGVLPYLRDDPETADRVLQQVLDKCPPVYACMVAVVYNRVDSFFRLANSDATVDSCMGFLEGAVEYLSQLKMWSSLLPMVDRWPHFLDLCKTAFVYDGLKFDWRKNDPACVKLFRKITHEADISDPDPMRFILKAEGYEGQLEQFKVLVSSPRAAVRQKVATNLKSLVIETCIERMWNGVSSERSARLGDCLMVAAQAGLFAAADPESGRQYMVMAAMANQPDLVLCLHHCGTLGSNDYSAILAQDKVKAIGSKEPAQVWGLGTRDARLVRVPFDEGAKKTAFDIKSFLAKKASTPSPLKKMCLQHLSKQAGWGHYKEEWIREAGILDSLKDELRLKGLEKVLKKEKQT